MNDEGSAPSPVYCINCGAQAKGVANYCHDCGSPIYRGSQAPVKDALSENELEHEDSGKPGKTSDLDRPQADLQSIDDFADTGGWAKSSSASEMLPSINQIKPFEYYLMAWKRYATFKGRSRRSEYWYFVLFNSLATFGIASLEATIGLSGEFNESLLADLYYLASLCPTVAVGVRRMHDTDHAAWWLFVPFANLVFLCRHGQAGSNQYGQNPKDSNGATTWPEKSSAGYTA